MKNLRKMLMCVVFVLCSVVSFSFKEVYLIQGQQVSDTFNIEFLKTCDPNEPYSEFRVVRELYAIVLFPKQEAPDEFRDAYVDIKYLENGDIVLRIAKDFAADYTYERIIKYNSSEEPIEHMYTLDWGFVKDAGCEMIIRVPVEGELYGDENFEEYEYYATAVYKLIYDIGDMCNKFGLNPDDYYIK